MIYQYEIYICGLREYVYGLYVYMTLNDFGSTKLSVKKYVHGWNLGAACYAFVQEPPPESLSLYVSPLGRIIVHICL